MRIAAIVATLLTVALVAACSKSEEGSPPAVEGASATANGLAPPPAPTEPPPPPTEEAMAWTAAALEELLAPIALYPDPILAQVLAASSDPQEVLDAGNWLLQNVTLGGADLSKAVADLGFSPSVQSLVHFPTVVDMMCREFDWTKQLGDAFSADQRAVLDAVQRLRQQASEAGNLASSPQMKVETTEQDGKDVIVIQPANPQVIYVPQYQPAQVYTPVPVSTTTTTTTTTAPSSGVSTETAVLGGLLAFTAGILIADAFDDDDYCYPHWGHGGVYYGGAPYRPHNTFIYAPHYSGYRPTPYYRPPGNYPHQYNNNRNYSGNNTNINIDNSNNYYNRFDKNQNRVSNYQPKSPVTRHNTARPSTSQRDNWKGNSTYAGGNSQRPTAATGTGQTRTTAQQRPAAQSPGARPATQQARPPQSRPAQSRPAQSRPAYAPDRGYPQTSGKRPDAGNYQQKNTEFMGAGGSRQASSDRAASQRGRSSMQGAPRPSSRSAPSRSSGGRR